MTLKAGSKLGTYEIQSPIGAGGMGEVYRARDTKLGRDVALKVLPEAVARDAERLARFRREAQVLASLNHPNIAAIYGFEDSGATHALVMELVEGQTLSQRIKQGALPLDEALPIAKQICEGLEYAHERGIIHRDLKPSNIKITPEGTAKILDFGLAKAIAGDSAADDIENSPTLSRVATQAGIILGTAAYMSPEQAKGKKVDRRADIWAFGVVLFEMLTGRRLFTGETTSDTLAEVLKTEPEWSALPANTPQSVRNLLHRCLKKDPRQRLQSIGDARIALEETLNGVAQSELGATAGGAKPALQKTWRLAVPWIVAAILIGLAGLAGWRFGVRGAPSSPSWFGDILPGPTVAMTPLASPDGHLIAFQAIVDDLTQVAVMDPRSGNWTVLTHDRTQGLNQSLSWSWDGSKIYYDRYNPLPAGVYSVPALGGESRLVLADAAAPEPLPDGSLLLARNTPDGKFEIYHYWPDSERLQDMHAFLGSTSSYFPMRVVPGGKEAVFWGGVEDGGADNSQQLYVLEIATGKLRRLLQEGLPASVSRISALAVVPDGRSVLVVVRSGDLYRVVAVPRSGKGSVRTLLTVTSAVTSLDAASDGNLYLGLQDRPAQILRFAESGGTPEVLASGGYFQVHDFSSIAPPVESSDGRILLPVSISGRPRLLLGEPGGNFVSLLESDEESGPPLAQVGNDEVVFIAGSPPSQYLALVSLKDGHILHRFESLHASDVQDVAASPDGKTLYYVSGGNVWSIPADGGTPRKVCAGISVAVDPNGKDLVVERAGQENITLARVPLSGGIEKPIPIKGDTPLSALLLGPNAINLHGQLLVSVQPTDSWFYRAAIIDLATGKMTQIPLNYDGDIDFLGWTRDGRIIATTLPITSQMWRFRPVANGRP